MKELVTAREELAAKQAVLGGYFEKAKTTVDGKDSLDLSKLTELEGDSLAKAEKIKALNDELTELGRRVDTLAEVEKARKALEGAGDPESTPATPSKKDDPRQAPTKSIGRLMAESKAFASKGSTSTIEVDLKTLFQTSAGWAPETTRTGMVVYDAQRPVQVTDIVPMDPTNQTAIVYMEETTFTNAAAEASEGGTYAESALALTEQSSPVRKIATFLPVTDEQLEDVDEASSYIDSRLRFMLRQRLDGQILTGDGNAPNLDGFLNVSGIQTQAKGADSVPDAIYKAIVKVRVTGRATPGAVIIHPNDWQGVRLLKTTDGIYIWGSPSEAGPARIWGLPVVEADAITENTALVGDYANFTHLRVRRDIDVQVSNSHGTYFVEGKQAIRADMRAALVVYRPAALCTVTGI